MEAEIAASFYLRAEARASVSGSSADAQGVPPSAESPVGSGTGQKFWEFADLGFDTQKKQRVTQPLLGHFEKAGSEPKSFIREFRLPDGTTLEGAVDLNVKQFAVGDVVDVIGQSKGKGFQGVIKKHGMAGQGASHGSMMHRRNGAIGNRSTPGRIWKNMGMPGHMGDKRVTVQNLRVVQVREDEGVILIAGAIPGANGGYVVVRPAKKAQPEAAK